jgi:hypothetical protein
LRRRGWNGIVPPGQVLHLAGLYDRIHAKAIVSDVGRADDNEQPGASLPDPDVPESCDASGADSTTLPPRDTA